MSSAQLVPGQIPVQGGTNGAIPTPAPPKGPQAHPTGPAAGGPGLPPFDAPRSPPGSKSKKLQLCLAMADQH